MSNEEDPADQRKLPRFFTEWRAMFEEDVSDFTPVDYLNQREGLPFVVAAQWLFCPEFTEYRRCVIIADRLDEKILDDWLNALNGDVSGVESKANLVSLGDLFTAIDIAPYEEDLSQLAHTLARCWRGLLRVQFPERDFVVEVYDDELAEGPESPSTPGPPPNEMRARRPGGARAPYPSYRLCCTMRVSRFRGPDRQDRRRRWTMTETATLSYAHGVSDVPLLGQTIGENLDRAAESFPDREALVDVPSGRRWTYERFNADVDTLARGLIDSGIDKGDRVGIWSPNNPEWVLLQYATAKIGAILVNINPAYRTHELAYALNQSEIRLLVSAESFKTSDYRAIVEEVRPQCQVLERVVYIGTPQWNELMERGRPGGGPVGQGGGKNTAPDALRERAAGLSFDDPINIQYTSGTTGYPKGATLSHHNILNNGFFIGEFCRYTEADRVCIPVPFYHCFGMVLGNLACTTHGSCIVIPAPAFEPAATLDAVQAEGCTSLYGVPTMFIAELGLPDFLSYDLSSLRTGIMAGSPCPVEVMKRAVDDMHMTDVTICYGMTETSPVSTQTRPDDDLERRVSTVGRVHPHVEIKVIDPGSGLTVPRGTPGELCTRGYSVMLGYWNDPERTDEVIDSARWMHTGDLATMDADGYLNIVGRIKDMVIRGGENIYPREIEEFLYTHPAIEDVQVIGVPDPKYGEELCAWVRVREQKKLTEDEIKEFCRGRLAHFKIPRYVRFTDDFPMTVTGKIQKFKMREQSIADLGLDEVARSRTA